jgi:hypothetical protein
MGWEIVECRCTVLMLCSVMSMWLVVDMISGAHKLAPYGMLYMSFLLDSLHEGCLFRYGICAACPGSSGCLYTGSCVEPIGAGMRALSMERRS